jgi:flagellin
MALTVLNNISSLTAENALANTQASLQKTLTQLSTGMKINSGSDDAAGLSIVSGMNANISALTQSQQNASNGVGLLQTADGALSQVTTLLNRAVTLATEGSTTGITASQSTALDTEFQSILSEINQIGQATNFNGSNVFGTAKTVADTVTGSVSAPGAMDVGSTITITDNTTGGTLTITGSTEGNKSSATNGGSGSAYTAKVSTAAELNAAITAAFGAGHMSGSVTTAEVITSSTDNFTVTSTDTSLMGVSSGLTDTQTTVAAGAANVNNVYIGDGTTASGTNTSIKTSIDGLSAANLGLSTDNLTGTTNAQAALTAITTAINTVSAARGVIGASVNRLTAANGDMASQVTNLQSAANSIQNADIGKTVANMTQYNVLQSTGMAALQQSNQAQQAVLKLVQ